MSDKESTPSSDTFVAFRRASNIARATSGRYLDDKESTPSRDAFASFRNASNIARETSRRSLTRLESSRRLNVGGLSKQASFGRGYLVSSQRLSVGSLSKQASFGRGAFATIVEENLVGLSSFLISCLITNYISVGYLLLPWAFAHTGMLLTSIIFTFVMGLTYVTSTYLMEACARAEFLAAQEEDSLISMGEDEEEAAQVPPMDLDATCFTDDSAKVTDKKMSQKNGNIGSDDNCRDLPVIKQDRKFELPDLARVFLGERWQYFFTMTTLIDLYGITWTAASVFALSLDVEFSMGNGDHDYEFFILIFAAIVIPLSFFAVIDQVQVQMGFLCGRVLMVLLMMITTAAAYQSDKPHFQDPLDGSQWHSVPLADTSNISASIQIAIFSTAYQFSVPVIAEASKHKSKLPQMYGSACTYLFVTMLVLSLVVAGYFGPDYIEESCNLNWKNYTGGTRVLQDDGTSTGTAWWAKLISYYVVFFPVIDGVSLFSLCAFSLGEILKGFWYGDKVHELEDDWKKHIFFRLLGCVPQLVGATFVSDLNAIAKYAGIFTVLSYTVCPCLVAIYSSKLLRSVNLPTKTRYHTVFSNEICGWLIAFLGIASIVYAVVGSMIEL